MQPFYRLKRLGRPCTSRYMLITMAGTALLATTAILWLTPGNTVYLLAIYNVMKKAAQHTKNAIHNMMNNPQPLPLPPDIVQATRDPALTEHKALHEHGEPKYEGDPFNEHELHDQPFEEANIATLLPITGTERQMLLVNELFEDLKGLNMSVSQELEKLANLFDLIDLKDIKEQNSVLDALNEGAVLKHTVRSCSGTMTNVFKVASTEKSFCILKRIGNDTSSLNYAIDEGVDSPYIVSFTDLHMTNSTTSSEYVWRISEELNYDPHAFD